jgi:2-hydroxychromene-2-carboxylate isomerase
MAEPIEFYFDFSSPYGYLLSEKVEEVAARHDRKVRWRPILLGVVFKATGSAPLTLQFPAKAEYSVRDFERSARFLGVPYRHPSKFPLATQAAARAFYWIHGQNHRLSRDFAHGVYRALFVEDRDISSPDTVLDIAAGLGLDRDQVAAGIQSQEMKDRLKAECDLALEKGVFGSPYVIIGGEPFFGSDRLPQIERWLETGGF